MAHKKNKKQRDKMFQNGYLWCSKCTTFLPISKFTTGGKHYGKYSWYCKNCQNAYSRKNGYADRSRKKWRDSYRTRKEYFSSLYGGKCKRCGWSDSFWGLEFHHIYPSEKLFTPALAISNTNDKISISELNKCILLCSNCHKTLNRTWDAEFIKCEYGYEILSEKKLDIPTIGDERPPKPKLIQGTLI